MDKKLSGFSEIHSHFVYGIDDGARTRQDMEAMIDQAQAEGIVSLFSTPHVVPGVERFDKEKYLAHVEEARQYVKAKGYGINIFTGAELMYTPAMRNYISQHDLPTLAGSDCVLMEFVPDIALSEVEDALEIMRDMGLSTIIAHVERYDHLRWGGKLKKLKANYDVRFQVNANSLLTPRGFFDTRRMQNWIKSGLIDFVASDAHGPKARPFLIKKAYLKLRKEYGRKIADRLTGIERG